MKANKQEDHKQLLSEAFIQIANIENENQYILNSHLVAESSLNQILDKMLPNAKALKKSRFSFSQILAIVESLRGDKKERWIWQALSRLNKLRNEIAHNLSSSKISSKKSEFLKSTSPWIDPIHPEQERTEEVQLLIVLHILCLQLSNILNGESIAGPTSHSRVDEN